MTDLLAWEDLQLLLAVCRLGSFRAASVKLRLSVNTVRKRIERLEQAHGGLLFRRSFEGVTPTEIGKRLINVAEQMSSVADHRDLSDPNALVAAGELKIGTSEAIGSIWLAPRLLDLRAKLPDLTIGLYCDYDLNHDRSRDLDLVLQFERPRDPHLVCSRIATIHFMLHASRDYLNTHGTPRSLDDVRNFDLVEQVAPGIRSDFVDALIGSERRPSFVPLRTNSSLAVLWAVNNGAGIAAMPTYVCEVTDQIVPLALPSALRRELYLVYHGHARHSPAIRTAISWLRDAFDPDAHPWFAEDFVHPDEARRRPQPTLMRLMNGSAAHIV